MVTNKQTLTDQHLADVIHNLVNDLARMGNLVIVGRGSNIILQDALKTLHVATVASNSFRVKGNSKPRACRHKHGVTHRELKGEGKALVFSASLHG